MTLSRPPELFLLVLSGSFSLLAVLLALDALRRPRVGLAAWLPLSAGLASLLRVTGILLAERAREQALDVASIVSAYQQARWFSTLSMGLVMLGTLAGLLFLARRFLVRTLVAVLSATVLAGLASLAATRTPGVDESSFMVIARRSMQQLELRPETHLPPGLAHFLVAFGLATAIAVLVLRLSLRARSFPLAPPVLAAMALALLARDAADIPLFGLALAVSALTLAVVARTLEHGGDDAAGLPLPQSLLGRLSPSKRSRTAVPAPPNQLAPPS